MTALIYRTIKAALLLTALFMTKSTAITQAHQEYHEKNTIVDVVSSDAIEIPGLGMLQYHHRAGAGDSSSSFASSTDQPSCCDAIVFLQVGTKMAVTDYTNLAREIVKSGTPASSLSSTVAIFVDSNPGGMCKQDPTKLIPLVNAIASNITNLIPTCCHDSHFPRNGYLLGGHSGGGEGAVRALMMTTKRQRLNFNVSGFVGLAPFEISSKMKLAVPSLLWGFSRMTCLVPPRKEAIKAYQISQPGHRIFYQLETHNANVVTGGPHCSFANHGCFGMCAGDNDNIIKRDNMPFHSWMHQVVGETVNRFLGAIRSEKWFERAHFTMDWNAGDKGIVKLFLDDDC